MITQIEQELHSINEDKFANISRIYLAHRYNNVLSTGFALGQEKSKAGIPDNFIPLKEDFYVFNEITTVLPEKLKTKLKKDIADCFKQKQIKITKIAKIILICNRKVSPKLYDELIEYKNNFSNIELEIIGIDDFANHIFRDYPSLCLELGIPIDTGQILEIKSFIQHYEKSKFATTLKNKFYNRENELSQAINYLTDNKIVLIHGQAGVGKTKLSLEIAREFLNNNSKYRSKYIINNAGAPIWDDLKSQLITDKNYLLVLDDANKIKSNLEFIVNFLKEERKGDIKILLTVRDYVKNEVVTKLNNFNFKSIEIKNFNKEELSKILTSKDFNISNYGIDKIYDISKGNPRLAIMTAKAALNKDYNKFHNAAIIFEEYFSSIKNDLESLKDKDLLKVAGILSIVRNIDIGSKDVTYEISLSFGISEDVLIDKLRHLHQCEVADEFNGAYKIADQILGEYIFYLVFIDKQYISFRKLLELEEQNKGISLPKTLNPIVQNYGFEKIKEKISPIVKEFWQQVQNTESYSLKFLSNFWFYLPSESLLFVKNRIEKLNEIELTKLQFSIYEENITERYNDEIINLLIKVRQFPEKSNLVLQLLLKYCLTNQINFSKLLKVFKQSFSYGQYSYEEKYENENTLFEFLYEKTKENSTFYSKIILFIADDFLIDSYESISNEGSYMIAKRIPIFIDEQKGFREKLWKFIFSCFKNSKLQEHVYSFFEKYNHSFNHNRVKEVVEYDKNFIIPFFKDNFSKNSFKECEIIYEYLRQLDFTKIKYDSSLKSHFTNKAFKLFLTLNDRPINNPESLTILTNRYVKNDYLNFLELLNIIYQNKTDFFDFNNYSIIKDSISEIFIKLANTNFTLFLEIFQKLNDYEYSANLLIGKIFDGINYDETKTLKLRNIVFNNNKQKGLIILFLQSIPEEYFTSNDYQIFKNIIFDNDATNFWFLDIIYKKTSLLNINIEKEITEIVTKLYHQVKGKKNTFIHETCLEYFIKNYPEIFTKKIEQFQYIYSCMSDNHHHFDYHAKVLHAILKKDPKFILKVLKTDKYGSYNDKNNHLSNLWNLENAEQVISYCFTFFKKVLHPFSNSIHPATIIFKGNKNREENLLKFIIQHSTDEKILRILFNIVLSKYNDKKFEYLKLLLQKNNNLDFFKKLDFYILSTTFSGSILPRILFKINQYKELKCFLESLNNLDLLPHINYIENTIHHCKRSMEWEQKREFLSDWGI